MSSAPFSTSKFVSVVSLFVILSLLSGAFIGFNAGTYSDDPIILNESDNSAAPEADIDAELDDGGVRGSRATIYERHGGGSPYVLTGSHTYDFIYVTNGHLRIVDADVTIRASVLGQPANFNVSGANTTLEIINSKVITEWGDFNAHCKNISIENSQILTTNKTNPDFPDGFHSNIDIISFNALTIKNSDIVANGDWGDTDGPGGHGFIKIGSEQSRLSILGTGDGIDLSGVKYKGIVGLGGDGGDSGGETKFGRKGGDGWLELFASGEISIQDTNVMGQGGIGGNPEAQGGSGYFDLDAQGHSVNVVRTHIGADGGLDGNNKKSSKAGKGETEIDVGKFYMDKPNYMETKDGAKSTIYGTSIVITAPNGPSESNCELYNPKIESSKTVQGNRFSTLDDSTVIKILYWLTVRVWDNTGNLLEDAIVAVEDKSGHELASGNTDANGEEEFPPIVGLAVSQVLPDGKIRMTLKASKYNVVETYEFFLLESYTLDIVLTLLTITVTDVNGKTPSNEMEVGCSVEVIGTCARPEGAGGIDSVTAKVDGNTITPGPVDTSSDSSWTTWKLTWNSVSVTDAVHKLEFEVKIGTSLSDFYILNVTVNQRSCNHAPEVLNITTPTNNEKIFDSDEEPWYIFRGTAYDEDWDSDLTAEQGAKIDKVTIKITNSMGNDVITPYGILSDFMEYDELTGIYDWSYQWSIHETEEGYFIFPNGIYNITVSTIDKAGFAAQSWGIKKVTVELYHLITPVAIIDEVTIGENLYEDTSIDIEYKTKKRLVSVTFDAKNSYDIDGNITEIQFKWDFGDGDTSSWTNESSITHDYNMVNDFELYRIELMVRDRDDLESKNKGDNEATVKLTFVEPDPETVGPFSNLFELNLEGNANMFYAFIVIIVILNVVGALYVVINNKRISRQREAQRAMMEQQRRELAAEIAKERKESGYGDFTDKYMIKASEQKQAVSQAVSGTMHDAGTVAAPAAPAAAPTPAAPAPAAKPELPQAQPPAEQSPAEPAAAPAPATPPAQPPAQPAAPAAAAPAPAAQPPAEQPAPQMVACPSCSAQIAVNTSPCPSCGQHFNWQQP